MLARMVLNSWPQVIHKLRIQTIFLVPSQRFQQLTLMMTHQKIVTVLSLTVLLTSSLVHSFSSLVPLLWRITTLVTSLLNKLLLLVTLKKWLTDNSTELLKQLTSVLVSWFVPWFFHLVDLQDQPLTQPVTWCHVFFTTSCQHQFLVSTKVILNGGMHGFQLWRQSLQDFWEYTCSKPSIFNQ